ncbi:MAG: S8 family serine peptidase [bacterium]|nr:S8 family serine peptidase [bacterium]
MALENHTQFGPHDAPLDIDKGLHPQLWAERVIVEQTLLAVTGEGNQVVVVDTGVLNDKEAPLIHRSGLGKHSEREKPKRPVNGASIPAFYGHGTFVAGKVLTANPDAVVQVFRPDGFSPVKGDSALVLTDDDLAAVLARALFVMAGEPGGPQPRLSNKERALQAEQAMTAQPDLKPAVLNLSLAGADHGVPDPLPATLEILKVWLDLGIKVVAAAGNDHTDAPHYPAAYDGVIGVGAVDRANTDADFSNYGSWVDEKRLGVNVVSAYLEGGSDRSSVKVPKPTGNPRMPHRSKTRGPWDGLASWSGTSFAAPQVAGELSI